MSLCILWLVVVCGTAPAQAQKKLIQVAGIVADSLSTQPLPFAQVVNVSAGRVTIADTRGYFSMVCREGDTLALYYIGYRPLIQTVQTGGTHHTHFIEAYLTKDTIRLSPTVVSPWPTYQAFKYAVLHMEDILQQFAPDEKDALSPQLLQQLARNAPPEGYELQTYTLQEHAASFYHAGQYPYVGLFNPFAWAKFFQWLAQQRRARNR